jgi:putative CocE/NonD family hydrolase
MSLGWGTRVRANVRVAMRDGVELSTDLYLPEGPGPFPVVLSRTPYNNTLAWIVAKARTLADAGYAVAMQDVRGRFDSYGEYEPFRDEGPDGADTIAWLAAQPWCNGRVGMTGRSYSGWTQWTAAAEAPPHLAAIVPRVMATDLHRGLMWRGGAFNLGVLLTWGLNTSGRSMQELAPVDWVEAFRTLPLDEAANLASQDLPFWRDWLAHPAKDGYWDAVEYEGRHAEMPVPALVMGGWYDLYADDVFRQFAAMRGSASPAARHSQLIVGPWPHALSASTRTGSLDFGARSLLDLESAELRWFDRWLKLHSNGAEDDPPIRLFMMGSNEWRSEHEWPLARTDWQPWYLHSGGRANTLAGDGVLSLEPPADEPADRFTFDPAVPVPTNGGGNCCSPDIVPWGAYDQRDLEMRPDVLCYTSAPLSRALDVIGPITVVLWAATDALDTDWTGKLVDVWPSGRAINLCDGIQRARFRHSPREERLLTPGELTRYEIDLMVTGNTFLPGHRIRLEISSSNFPRFDRNPNTGAPIGTARDTRPAHQAVVHDRAHPSHVLLPVIAS